ncbi:MAG: hypothetical protein ACLTTQ_01750 [Christensenellales bacterium]
MSIRLSCTAISGLSYEEYSISETYSCSLISNSRFKRPLILSVYDPIVISFK